MCINVSAVTDVCTCKSEVLEMLCCCAVVWSSRWSSEAVQRCWGRLFVRALFAMSRQQHVCWQHEFWINTDVHLSSWSAWWQLWRMYALFNCTAILVSENERIGQLWCKTFNDTSSRFDASHHCHVQTPHLPPLGHIWDVMLVSRKWNIKKTICATVLCTVIMVHKTTSSSYRLVESIGLWSCLVSSERLRIFGLHGAIYILNVSVTSFSSPFSELSLVGLALDLVD